MMRLVGVELFKFRTQRAHVLIFLLGLALTIVSLGFLFLATQIAPEEGALSLEAPDMQRQLLSSTGTSFVVLLLAILAITGEFRHGTISSTLRGVPDRHRLIIVKAITYGVIALAFGVLAALLNQLGARTIFGMEDVDIVVQTDEVLAAIGKSLLALVLFAILGIGIAALVANQVAAILIVVLEPFGSSIVAALLPEVGKYLPSQALAAFAETDRFVMDALSPATGLVVFVLYVVAALAAGMFAFSRRDIA